MAISTGVRIHRCWLEVNGETFLIKTGTADLHKTQKSNKFSATVPLRDPLTGLARDTFWRDLGDNEAKVFVRSGAAGKSLVTGEIDSASVHYVDGTVHVSGRCVSAKLLQRKSAEKFQNQRHSDVVKTLLGRAGIKGEVEDSALMAGKRWNIDFSSLTDGMSYLGIIHKLAEADGARWWTDGEGVFHYTTQGPDKAAYKIRYVPPTHLTYGFGDCADLKISRNIQAGKGVKTRVHSWNQREKKNHIGEAEVPGRGKALDYTYHVPDLDPEHAERHAKSRAKDHARHELKLTGTLVGDTSLEIDQPLELEGNAFAQTFELDHISHKFGESGHSMSVQAKSAAKGRTPSSRSRSTGPNVSGQAGEDSGDDVSEE